MDQMEGMKTGEPLSSFVPIRSSPRSLRSEARPAVLPPGERAQRSACLLPRRGTGRRSMSFCKAREKKEGLIVFFPTAIHCSPARPAPRIVFVPIISWFGPATAEALWRLRSRGLHMDLADGLETGSPYLHLLSPDLALSLGGSLCCSSSPLSESALI